jgi:hypothetical protein
MFTVDDQRLETYYANGKATVNFASHTIVLTENGTHLSVDGVAYKSDARIRIPDNSKN